MDTNMTEWRRYTRSEAAAMLNIRDYWLRDWVSQHRIPHQRKGARGVWFTLSDIENIGRQLPSLMSPRQGNSRAARENGAAGTAPAPVDAGTVDLMTRFGGLRSARR
jgi:hypothetical protein